MGRIIFVRKSNLAFAQPQIKKGVIPRPGQKVTEERLGVEIRDNPVIREFSLTPSYWLADQSGNAVFNWRVEPSPGGSRITRITITKTEDSGQRVNISSSNPTGQYTMGIPSSTREGRTTYALTAVNFEIKSPEERASEAMAVFLHPED